MPIYNIKRDDDWNIESIAESIDEDVDVINEIEEPGKKVSAPSYPTIEELSLNLGLIHDYVDTLLQFIRQFQGDPTKKLYIDYIIKKHSDGLEATNGNLDSALRHLVDFVNTVHEDLEKWKDPEPEPEADTPERPEGEPLNWNQEFAKYQKQRDELQRTDPEYVKWLEKKPKKRRKRPR